MNQKEFADPTAGIPVELGAIPLIIQEAEAFQTGDEKEPKKLYRVSIQAVLDSFQLGLLMMKVEGHTAYAEIVAPREIKAREADRREEAPEPVPIV
jgi:hypothetical protein